MRRPNMRNVIQCLLAALLLTFAIVGNAMAGCDRNGGPELFGLMDSWHLKDNTSLGQADFADSCDTLLKCYSTSKASKRSCDATYSRNLKKECAKTFGFHPKALAHCIRVTDRSSEFIDKEADAIFRRGQRQAGIEQRLEERNQRAEERKTRSKKRRERRVDRYKSYNPGS
jgi:hypothetical protein